MKQNKKHKVKKYNQIEIENLREREREKQLNYTPSKVLLNYLN